MSPREAAEGGVLEAARESAKPGSASSATSTPSTLSPGLEEGEGQCGVQMGVRVHAFTETIINTRAFQIKKLRINLNV